MGLAITWPKTNHCGSLFGGFRAVWQSGSRRGLLVVGVGRWWGLEKSECLGGFDGFGAFGDVEFGVAAGE